MLQISSVRVSVALPFEELARCLRLDVIFGGFFDFDVAHFGARRRWFVEGIVFFQRARVGAQRAAAVGAAPNGVLF